MKQFYSFSSINHSWMDGWLDRQTNRWTDRLTNGKIVGWTNTSHSLQNKEQRNKRHRERNDQYKMIKACNIVTERYTDKQIQPDNQSY